MTTKKDMAIPNDTEGGEAVPTPDDIEAGSLRCQMSKIGILARKGGRHNETCGNALFILVAQSALHFPRVPR